MSELLTVDEMREKFLEKLKQYKVEKSFSYDANVSRSFISHIKLGNQPPSKNIAKFLGYEKITMYRKIEQ